MVGLLTSSDSSRCAAWFGAYEPNDGPIPERSTHVLPCRSQLRDPLIHGGQDALGSHSYVATGCPT